MDPATILAAVSGASQLLQALIPELQKLFASGQVSDADQAKVQAEYLALRALGDEAFTGPEWEQSGISTPDPLPS